MKNLIILSSLLISFTLLAADTPKVLFYQKDKKSSEKIEIKVYKNVKMNAACFASAVECLNIVEKKIETSAKIKGLKGNPASIFCESNDGVSVILKDDKNNDYDYCQFKGRYMVDSWDLYEKFKK